MAYRYTDSNKWQDSWFVDLTSDQKLTFLYLCDNCDIAGFFELSQRKMAFDLQFSPAQVEGALKGLQRGFMISNDNRVIFLKNFVKHQKNLPLNPVNKAHKGILMRIELYRSHFSEDILALINGTLLLSPFEGASKGLPSPTGNGNGSSSSNLLLNNLSVEINLDEVTLPLKIEKLASSRTNLFVEEFNKIKGTPQKPARYKADSKIDSLLKARLKNYTPQEILTAVRNCKNDPYHLENPKYLTPEFILRADKLQKYLNAQELPKKNMIGDNLYPPEITLKNVQDSNGKHQTLEYLFPEKCIGWKRDSFGKWAQLQAAG